MVAAYQRNTGRIVNGDDLAATGLLVAAVSSSVALPPATEDYPVSDYEALFADAPDNDSLPEENEAKAV